MRFKNLLISTRSFLNTFKPTRNLSTHSLTCSDATIISTSLIHPKPPNLSNPISLNPNSNKSIFSITRNLHSFPQTVVVNESESESESEEDAAMTEFLSRFVWVMRGKLSDAYPTCDKPTVNGMLLVIVEKVVEKLEQCGVEEMLDSVSSSSLLDFSEDLWKTVWEVSNSVLEDMKKERKKQEMKKYTQCEEVKEMCRFASEVGVRGNMLREFRFKWAKEKMEEVEFYQELESIREEDRARAREEEAHMNEGEIVSEEVARTKSGEVQEVQPKIVSLPQRRGKIKYKIYGLDLSDPKWAQVADKIHESEKLYIPEEPKEINGKCKLVTEKILNLTESDDPLNLLAEWMELLGPSKVDWVALLNKIQERNIGLYSKVAELLLDEDSFQANIRDYSKLIDTHSKENRIPDAERILEKMTKKGIQPDILTYIVLVNMYSKAGNIDRAKEAFEQVRSQRFQPDFQTYNSMIMAYVNAGQPKFGETLMTEMEMMNIKPTKEIYMALLRSYSEMGHADYAYRISMTMQYVGIQTCLEWSILLVEAYANAGDPDQARKYFNELKKYGQKPDDRITASLLRAYSKKNSLDKALDLMLNLEKEGFKPGIMTNTVWLDWFVKLGLIEEAEEVYKKIKETGDMNSIRVQVRVCVMYLVTKDQKKALQALGILEGKKDELGKEDFEMIVNGLIACGLTQDALRFEEMMKARGFPMSDPMKMSLKVAQVARTMPTGRKPSFRRY